MKVKIIVILSILFGTGILSTFIYQGNTFHPEFRNETFTFGIDPAYAYPPAVGILSSTTNCLGCHANNGPWKDDANTIVDILDMETKTSLKQYDGSFLIEVSRWEQKTVLTVIGHKKAASVPAPYRNAWLYIDPATIGSQTLSKFAPAWDVNLPMSCRVVGDQLPGYEDADITSLPMTIQPLGNAQNAQLQLQVMLTAGESIKGKAQEGMLGNYFEKSVRLIVK